MLYVQNILKKAFDRIKLKVIYKDYYLMILGHDLLIKKGQVKKFFIQIKFGFYN